MAWKKVINHDLTWNLKAKENEKGVINLIFEDETSFKLTQLTSEDYSAIADMLHCGKNVWCKDTHTILRAGNEEPENPKPRKTIIPEVASLENRD